MPMHTMKMGREHNNNNKKVNAKCKKHIGCLYMETKSAKNKINKL